MSYWWASQNKNFKTAIPAGTLWTRPQVNGVLPAGRAALDLLRVDDVVFHYGVPYMRAVSRVVAPSTEAHRPFGYPRGPLETEENDDGRLALVETFATNLTLHRDRVAELITLGSPGPFTRHGGPREAFISPLTSSDAHALLAELQLHVPSSSMPGRPHEDWNYDDRDTDVEIVARVRSEQTALRTYLLDGRVLAECGLCGRKLEKEFLVAGHIMPRSTLSNAQRRRFHEIAMLVCLLGCDALFELGYIVVDGTGTIRTGRPPSEEHVQTEVARRVGRSAAAWTAHTAGSFRAHLQRHSA